MSKICGCTLSNTDACRTCGSNIIYGPGRIENQPLNNFSVYLKEFIPFTEIVEQSLKPKLNKDEISKIVEEKIRERGADFAFLNKKYLKILTDLIVDAIEESQGI
jgi:hypothetical protein